MHHVSSAQTTGSVPGPVDMDGRAILEAWLGPGAVDEALSRARWDAREMWRHLHALRLRVEGGATPGLVIDARFETPVDAEHAQFDLARMQRALERVAGEIKDEELTKIDFHLTAAFTDYISSKLDRERHPRTRRGC